MRLRLRGILSAALLVCTPLSAQSAPTIFGQWLTQDRDGVVDIRPCGANLCGHIVGLDVPRLTNGDVPRDAQGRPQCGLQILQARPTGAGQWDGRITDPSDGTNWHCTVRMDEQGRLKLRGYVLAPLFGVSQTWTPFAGALGADCSFK